MDLRQKLLIEVASLWFPTVFNHSPKLAEMDLTIAEMELLNKPPQYVHVWEFVIQQIKKSLVYLLSEDLWNLPPSLCYCPDPSFMDIWSQWRLNYDYANLVESYDKNSKYPDPHHLQIFSPGFLHLVNDFHLWSNAKKKKKLMV